jgi:hypothetical protein
MQRLDRHLDAFTASARHYMRVSPRPPQLVHDAYRNLVAVAVVLQPLKQALKQYDELDAPLSSKELGLRAIQLVVLELAPTAIALAREDTRLSESRVEFERKLYSLQQETRRIAKIWLRHRTAIVTDPLDWRQLHTFEAATNTAWDAWKRLRANRARDASLRLTLGRTTLPALRHACSAILKILYLSSFDMHDEDIRGVVECVLRGNASWR